MTTTDKEKEFINIKLSLLEPNDGQLEGLPRNPREIEKDKFELLKQNIKNFPKLTELQRMLVYPLDNGHFIIIGGNMRYRAMTELGMTEAPCAVIDKDTDIETLKAYAVITNNSFGRWDFDKLANDWSQQDLIGVQTFPSFPKTKFRQNSMMRKMRSHLSQSSHSKTRSRSSSFKCDMQKSCKMSSAALSQ